MNYHYDIYNGAVEVKSNTKKYIAAFGAAVVLALAVAVPTFAVSPGAAVKNPNANQNACWGQDRSYYASSGFFPENQSINQSFPGSVGEERQAWTNTYCEPHGPSVE